MSDGTRRGFLRRASLIASGTAAATLWRGMLSAAAAEPPAAGGQGRPISFNLSVHPVEFIENPDLGRLLVDSEIDKVWLLGWFYGRLRNRLFRVGEGHFGNTSFGCPSGKLAELASAIWNVNDSDQGFDVSCGGTTRSLNLAAGAVEPLDT